MSQLTPQSVNCGKFTSSDYPTLNSIVYAASTQGLVNATSPGVFQYWVKVTAAKGTNTFVINQKITSGNFKTLFTNDVSGSNVYDTSCKGQTPTITQTNANNTISNTLTVKWTAPKAGTYYIVLAFQTSNVQGKPAPSPSTVTYQYSTTGVAGSTSNLTMLLKK